jgi:hypothetical protein
MGDATRDDGLGRDTAGALPGYRRPGADGIRYASSGVLRAGRPTAGATRGRGVPYGTQAHGRTDGSSGDQAVVEDQAPSRSHVPGWHEPDQEPEHEPEQGWFGKRHPDLWVFGSSALVAAAAMITAFAAASGASATGYSQTPHGTATHAPVDQSPVARAGTAPPFGPACISVASTGAGR